MGVHGLRGLLKRSGIDRNDESTSIALPPHSTSLAIDGNGLIFHLFRISYHRHRQNIMTSFQTTSTTKHCETLQSQLLLPAFTPLSLLNEVTTTYLSELTTKHGIHLQIYFDGSDQYMKRREKRLRRGRREEEWENVRQLCLNEMLPENNKKSKYRSSARRQARDFERHCGRSNGGLLGSNVATDTTNADDSSEEELYLSSFPLSPLVMDQMERSIWAFADMSTVLPCGSVQIIQCNGEADVAVARASANDATGNTYALGNDTDYLIYGYQDDDDDELMCTRYIQFSQIVPSADDELRVGNVLTRSNVAASMGLPSGGAAMIELSILLGNDYTGPLVRDDDAKKRQEYWGSIQWCRGEEHKRLPPENELSPFDKEAIIEHVSEKVADGWKLMSDIPELQLAIQFSYALYSFGDISRFPSTAPARSTIKEEEEEEESSEDEIDDEVVVFPSLPAGLDISLVDMSYDLDLGDAALLPLTTYMSEFAGESNDLRYIEQRHLDAFRMTLDRVRNQNEPDIERPQRKLQWGDIQALYVLEKCLLEAVRKSDDAAANMPCQIFNHFIFHSYLESLSFEDFPLDNDLVKKEEKAFLEEATSEFPAGRDEEPVKNLVLPIDAHKDDILHTVKTQRVTIIHGETGCGKSSRVPCFLLRAPAPEPTMTAPQVKMIVSQPRRIAAKALAERVRSCEPDIADKIALRMGHGIREYETHKTRAWFVTTGYVVRLLANHPGWFDAHTHLIIDEVHERSIDTDILCLLCRRLLQSHPTIRLVLMSATMAAELYSQYFGAPQPPIHVGSRCFPIKEYFVEDLKSLLSLSPKHAKLAQVIYDDCEKNKCGAAPSNANMEKLHRLATLITASVGSHGSSVLIFVPGMSDIESIIELIEKLNRTGVTFICLPIHSDVPFEEQMGAFEPAGEGEVKVIIATNAAESSLTLPDVDHVICLGLCKQIVYNRDSHRQMLAPTWISRASATQRAGRTGRVRKGTVYRLYSRNAFKTYMQPFDQGELVRSPLDNTILSLRDMLDESVTPILLECLEPPDISTIERSFQSLHASNFISEATDDGLITSLGSLVVALGIDLTLGSFVGLGIQFGVAAEAIQIAAILSFPKPPWAISSPIYHDTLTFNEIVRKTFVSRCFFDAGLFSEPLAISNLLHDYSNCKNKNQFCWKHSVSATRIRHLYGTVESLKRRVAERLNVSVEVLEVNNPPYLMDHAKVNILRILHVWLFSDTMIVHNPSKNKIESVGGAISVELDGPPISHDHLAQILDAERHSFSIRGSGKLIQQGTFDSTLSNIEDRVDFFDSFEIRFASYALENNIDLSFYSVGTAITLFIPASQWEESRELRESILGNISVGINEVCFLQNTGIGNQRGLRGRACGSWHPSSIDSVLTCDGILPSKRVFVLSGWLSKSQAKQFKRHIDTNIANKFDSIKSILCCSITESRAKNTFTMSLSGECHEIPNTDLCDLFAAPDLVAYVSTSTMRQTVLFPRGNNINSVGDGSSNDYPLIEDAPEGARMLAVLASERRRDKFIRFSNGSDEEYIDVNIPKKFTGIKWKRKDGGMAFVPTNCVPAAAIPADKSMELFGCCANTLDLRGGACRVEGITMLPPGRLFAGLALLAFGINPRTGGSFDLLHINEYASEEKKEAGEENPVVQEAVGWIYEKDDLPSEYHEKWRVEEALAFHTACMELGEALECQPGKIKALCALFDGVNGHDMDVWDGYDQSLTEATASLRPKHIEKTKQRTSKSSNGKNRERLQPTTNTKVTVKKINCSDHMPSEETTSQLVDNKVEQRPHPSRPTTDSKDWGKFACSECKEIFTKWNACIQHRDRCCPGKRSSMKNAIALANMLEINVSSATPQPAIETQVNEANAKQSHPPKKLNIDSNTVWVCPSCNERFGKEKKCSQHIEKCLFGLVKHTKPKLMCVCGGCNGIYEPDKYHFHKKACRTMRSFN